jgi:SAM-dependent methyltransferase
MHPKKMIRILRSPLLAVTYQAKATADSIRIWRHKNRGQIPWSDGYLLHKLHYISGLLDSPQFIRDFASRKQLDPMFGWRLDERVVEIPWVFSKLSQDKTRILDAGSALNFTPFINRLTQAKKQVTILTLSPEEEAFWKSGVSYHFGDLREMPFRDNWFDEIISISTLEHVGMDNINYGTATESLSRHDFLDAARELRRILKPQGTLLITVPFGKPQDIMWGEAVFMQQFDENLLQQLQDCFVEDTVHTKFYKYTENGWVISTLEDCKEMAYFVVRESTAPAPDFAAAARAIACIEVTKQG